MTNIKVCPLCGKEYDLDASYYCYNVVNEETGERCEEEFLRGEE